MVFLRKIFFIFLSFFLFCNNKEEQEKKIEVEKFYFEFIDGMKKGDVFKIYELSCEKTKKYFKELFENMKKTVSLVKQYYPEEEKERTLENIAGFLVYGVTTPYEFFLNLIDRDKMSDEFTEEVVRIKDLSIIDNSTATLLNEEKNVFIFYREKDGKWRTDIMSRTFSELPFYKTLIKNLSIIAQNIELIKKGKKYEILKFNGRK